jgi:hypothetical protein
VRERSRTESVMKNSGRSTALGVAIFCLLLLSSCGSFSSKMDSWIGRPMQERLDILGTGGDQLEEVTNPDQNGNRVYVTSTKRGCRMFWTVDAQGIMRSWRSEGSACKYYTN